MPFGRPFLHGDAGHHDEQTRRSQNRHQAVTACGRDGATGPTVTRARLSEALRAAGRSQQSRATAQCTAASCISIHHRHTRKCALLPPTERSTGARACLSGRPPPISRSGGLSLNASHVTISQLQRVMRVP